MRKYSLMQKVMAIALTLIMVIGVMPSMTLNAAAAEQVPLTVTDRVADPETLNNWQDYYGDNSLLPDGTRGVSTWKAGGVWTDKSVFTDASAFPNSVTLDDPNAFLVSLSALASNQEIVGQSSAPIDTMLVLDLSNSMDQSGSVDDMIEAANDAIHALLEMNVNNRVGVVLYSGNSSFGDSQKSTATVILPLDRYTTTTSTTDWERVDGEWTQVTKYQYLSITGDNDTTVSVAEGTLNSSNRRPTGSKHTIGGTYIQNGLYQAYEAFAGMTDKGVVQSGTQAGKQRQPVVILMSDGAPTAATTEYNDVGTSNMGNGGSTTDQITFLTQLTAAWIKGAVADHYNDTEALFYTLGLGTANNANATAVLYPSGTTNDNLTTWWDNFLTGTEEDDGTVEVQEEVEASGRPDRPGYQPGQDAWYLDYDNDGFATGTGKNYVDRYWAASDADEMVKAFVEIVKEIGLQSAYSATLVESGEADLDGYITVEDELGSMMQVKDVKGIVIGSTLYSGQEFARNMLSLGDGESTTTTYGDEFVRSIKERLNITDTSQVHQLMAAAFADNQLYYNAQTGVYSNYIGWYGDENNGYLGFWDKDSGITATGAPSGTKYINRSYVYLGDVTHSGVVSDMMHIIVLVRTEITTGHQTVLFKVPSALIPMITYKVELEGESLQTATEVALSVEETDPIRLVYEVGLPDDVNNININQKVEEYLAKAGSNHIHKDEDGNYVFFANSWDDNHDAVAPDIANMTDAQKNVLKKVIAESHFIPNIHNERFYILEDSLVYTKSGDTYSKVTSQPAVGTDYYFTRTIVTMVNGTAQAVTQYEKLYDATVANAARFQQNSDGYWEVKAGTPRQSLSALGLPKVSNATETIANSDHLWVYIAGTAASEHNIYSFLGNNGKLTVKPATGLKVTKEVTELADGASADEKFEILVTIDAKALTLAVTDADGVALTDYTVAENSNQTVVTVKLADGENAYITGIDAGTAYTVTEAANDNYSYTYTGATETVAGEIAEGVVTNEPVRPGNLYITKEVEHAVEGESHPVDHEFDFEVTFVDAEGKPIANTTFQLENNHDATLTQLTTDENGVMRGKLKHGETTYIKGIPAGAVVTVKEVNIPDNYISTEYRSRNITGQDADNDGVVTIVADANATVVVTNIYEPKSTTVDLDIAGTKIFDAQGNEEVLPAGGFTFKVQQWNGSEWTDLEGKSARVEYAAKEDGTKTFTIENVLQNIEYKKAGTYTYQVMEVIGNVANVTYDRTLYTFTVTVTDNNGQLVATVTDLHNAQITDGSYEVTFENTFHTAPVSIDIAKEVDNKSGNPEISKAGFDFVAVQTDANWNPLTGDDASSLTVTSDGAGEARVAATYKQEGHYYYILSETNAGKTGWTYSQTQYKIEVVVTKDDTGDLSATLIIDGVDKESDNAKLTFTNTYDPADAEVSLGALVKKNLEGRELKAGEFKFAIFENGKAVVDADGNLTNLSDAVATGTNDVTGNVTFEPAKLTFGTVGKYAYDVIEIKGELGGVTYDPTIYDLVVEVTDNGSGTLAASYYYEDAVELWVEFKNTYSAQPTEVVIEGLKTLKVNSGMKPLNAGDYTFVLYNEAGEQLLQTTNLANGTFVFDAIEYTGADVGKTFTYTVKELAPDGTTDGSYSANGTTYSGASFTVSVTVVDNGDGTLSTEVTGNGVQAMEFVNEYSSKPVSVSLPGTKTLEGRDLVAGEFKYALYKSDETFASRELVSDEITHDAQGNITFSFGTLGMGYHYFVVKEVIPETRAPGIHYDASEYRITVQVVDNGAGQMTGMTTVKHAGDPNAVNPAIAFKNIYKPEDGELILSGTKTYNGGKALTDDVFSVGLYEGDVLLQRAHVKADGSFTFQALAYTAEDVGKTYTYTVVEDIPHGAVDNGNGTYTLGNDIYDATVYTVVVTVADENKDGTLEITKTVNGAADGAISFTNTFVPTPIQHTLQAKKTYEKGLQGGDFEFRLTSTDGKTNVDQTKENAANGDIVFDPISFSAAGEYQFKLTEKKEGILSFIRPSDAEYEITITVVNENGVLRVSNVTSVNTKGTNESNLEFVNTYVMDGEGEVTLRGTKTLTGDRTTVNEGEFAFGLYDEAGTLVETVKNDASGNFAFSTLTFDETDVEMNGETVLTYTVKEIPGDNVYMTYDETVYTVTITVSDDDKGGIEVSHTISGGANDGVIAFTNTYAEPEPVEAYVKIIKNVKNLSDPGITAEGFEFVIQLGEQSATDVSNAEGVAGFTINLDVDDIGQTYEFQVSEKKGSKAGVTYDNTVHTVTVAVTENPEDGSLIVTMNGQQTNLVEVEFTNTYEKPAVPVTGDSFQLFLVVGLLAVSAAAIVILLAFKKKSNKGKFSA